MTSANAAQMGCLDAEQVGTEQYINKTDPCTLSANSADHCRLLLELHTQRILPECTTAVQQTILC